MAFVGLARPCARSSAPVPLWRRRADGGAAAARGAVSCKAAPPRGSGGGVRILELPLPFGALVKIARTGWSTAWLILMNELAPSNAAGDYTRPQSSLRRAANDPNIPAEAGRYTVYVGKACPWCHRVLLALAVFDVADSVKIEFLEPGDGGQWRLSAPHDGLRDMKSVYRRGSQQYTGRFTAPLLADNLRAGGGGGGGGGGTPRCNESSDLVQMIAHELAGVAAPSAEQRRLCERIAGDVNNGVYKCGFAKNQSAYERALAPLLDTLDELDDRLSRSGGGAFLGGGDSPGVPDVLLFPTLFRFDAVYAPLFHCTARSVRADWPALHEWARRMYRWPRVADTCDLEATVQQYFGNLFPLNPSGIVPRPPPPSFVE